MAPVWDVTVFTKKRDRVLGAEVASKFFAAVLADPQVKPLLSSEYFSVAGTLIAAWASIKSFRPKDGSGDTLGPGRNGERDFHAEKRSDETHASTMDPDARLARKSNGQASKLCYAGHVVIENRHGLAVAATKTRATRTAERDAGEAIMAGLDRAARSTLGGDKTNDTRAFVRAMGDMGVTPHVTQHTNGRRSAIDGRTTRHPGYAVSQRIRKRIEEVFGRSKEIGGMLRTLLRGLERVGWSFTLRVGATTSSGCRSCWRRLPDWRRNEPQRGSSRRLATENHAHRSAKHLAETAPAGKTKPLAANFRSLLDQAGGDDRPRDGQYQDGGGGAFAENVLDPVQILADDGLRLRARSAQRP